MKRELTKLLLVIILLVLTLQSVSAWGILPARYLADYSQDTQELTFKLRNTGFDEGYFQISFSGELAPYANYNGPSTVFFSSTTAEQEIPISFRLDTQALSPGRNRLRVIFNQLPPESEVTVGSAVTLVAEVIVDVPYSGDFIEAKLFTTPSPVNEPTPFEISLINKGEDPVNVYATMRVLGPTNQQLASWQTPPFILGYQSVEKIRTSWNGQKEPGTYVIEALVHYGEKTTKLTSTFIVGSKEVEILGINAQRFRLGEINQLAFTARNTWNDALDDVYAEIFVVDNTGKVLQSFKTQPENFLAYQTQELKGFWDTDALEVGRYTLNVVSYVGEENFQYSFPVTVAVDEIILSANVVATEEDEGSINSLIVILLVIVLITNVVLILYFKKNKK